MFVNQVDFMVARERHDDFLREAEYLRLVRAVEKAPSGDRKAVQKATVWVGHQLVKWGWTLQRYGTVQPAHTLQVAGEQFERGNYE